MNIKLTYLLVLAAALLVVGCKSSTKAGDANKTAPAKSK